MEDDCALNVFALQALFPIPVILVPPSSSFIGKDIPGMIKWKQPNILWNQILQYDCFS